MLVCVYIHFSFIIQILLERLLCARRCPGHLVTRLLITQMSSHFVYSGHRGQSSYFLAPKLSCVLPKGREPASSLGAFLLPKRPEQECPQLHSDNRPDALTKESGLVCLDALVHAGLPLLPPPPLLASLPGLLGGLGRFRP